MKAEGLTTEELTIRYEDALTIIRDGGVPTQDELLWFADTSMEFAATLATVFTEASQVVSGANMLLNAISQYTDPKTMHPNVVAAVIALGILLGHMTPEEMGLNDDSTEVLQ